MQEPRKPTQRQGNGVRTPSGAAADARRRQMQRKQYLKRRRRKWLLRIGLLAVAGLLLLLVLIGGILLFRRLFAGEASGDAPTTGIEPVSQTVSEIVTETAEPPVLYTAPNEVEGEILVPYRTENTLYLYDIDANTDTVAEDAAVETVSSLYADCTHALLFDAESGEIVVEKGGNVVLYPASMTKLMTVLVAYEACTDLSAPFTITSEIIDPVYLEELSLAGFSPGETVTILDLLYGCALPSVAEASVALAMYTAGSEEAFVELMNLRAASLGMKDTHFTNCIGAHDEKHVSTLSDIGVLMAFMMQDETLKTILSTYQYTTTATTAHPEGLVLTSTVFGRMAGDESTVCEVIGGKTGYTPQAQQCLVTYACRMDTGRPFVCVLAGGDTKWEPVFDTIRLYQYATYP